ncbi:MAG TPA: double-strand break repair helicase AddA, partial [Rhodospirillaceae bacterium]|nr:double-strand break repair helicase AddA [Rhodospirillaceae bacterium]
MSSLQPQKTDAVFDVNRLQREASNPDSSVWVSASAGSGKTKVLSDRITRLLLEGVPPQKILCLTFTKAAAAEMSIRLTQRLSKWATCDDKALDDDFCDLQGHAPDKGQHDRARRLFAKILSCPGGMRIQTIHSFAQEILYRFPLEAGLAPHFTVLEEAGAEALKKEALSDFLEKIAEGKDVAAAQALKILVPAVGERQLALLLKEVGSQREKWTEILVKEKGHAALLSRLREKLDLDEGDSKETFMAQACSEDSFDRKHLLHLAQALTEKGAPQTAKKAGKKINLWLEQDAAGRVAAWDVYKKAFLTDKGEGRKDVRKLKLLKENPELDTLFETESLRLKSLAERFDTLRLFAEGAALMTLGMGVVQAYAARKASQAALDFDDLILRAKELLSRTNIVPWVLFKLDGGIDHILLDEAQDTNPTQWQIVKILTDEFFSGEGAQPERDRTLFVVGDEKQSIYSFLKADPEEFERMRVYFKEKIGACGKDLKETPLHVSFRSAPAVLRAVDAVFAHDTVRQGVSQVPVHHRAFREKAKGRVEVWDLFAQEKTEEKGRKKESTDWLLPLDYESAIDPVVGLAQALAVRIKNWIDEGRTIFDRDLEAERSIRPEDVMVLVQTRGAFVDHFVRALKNEDVPVSGVDRMRLTDQIAVMDLMALMQFTLLPQDNLNLACVLRGPLIGASEEDLMKLCIKGEVPLWQSLLHQAKTESRFAVWRDYLEALALQADLLEPLAFLIHVLTQSCPCNERTGRRALAARLGPEAEDPIDELLNLAEDFKTQKGASLQAFLQWLIATEAEIKRELEQAEGRVRITTVHRSKGLESPIVILPDTVRVPRSNALPKILWDSVSGLPFYVPSRPLNGFLRSL